MEVSILITPKYADDVTYALKDAEAQVELKRRIPQILATHDLMINHTKTEEYEIPKPPPPPPPPPTMEELIAHKDDKVWWSALDWLVHYVPPPIKDETPDWRKCKLLGSQLESNVDFKRRKQLAINTLKKHNHIFTSKHIGNGAKIRTFHMYIGSVFLHNTETWAVNKTLSDKIDSFQRRMLRYAINYKWPKKISNEQLHEKTKCESWSRAIKRRRLTFLGHVMRLNENTPVRIALNEALTPTRNKVGRPKDTWLKTIADDLNSGGYVINTKRREETMNTLLSITQDRKKWRSIVKTLMQQ